MARPTKPKDLKPKAEGEVAAAPEGGGGGGGGAAFDIKYIVLLVVVVLASVLGSAGSAYLMSTMVVLPELNKTIAKAQPADGAAEGGGDAAAADEESKNQVGMNLELDEFTVNLKADPTLGGAQYLRSKMALSIKVPEKENCYLEKKASVPTDSVVAMAIPGGKIAGAAVPVTMPVTGSATGPQGHVVDRTMIAEEGGGPTCEDIFKGNMGKYVPTVRDVINGALMKRTATQLASLEGQEALKDEIKEQLNAIMGPDYEVLRVNFQDFIIQK